MLKVLVIAVVVVSVWCKPQIISERKDLKEDEVPNSFDERLQQLQSTVDSVVGLIRDQNTKIADLRAQQDQIKHQQDANKIAILNQINTKAGGKSLLHSITYFFI